MSGVLERLAIEEHAPVKTWLGVGGGARRMARPTSAEDLALCLEIDAGALVLGDGANLLVEDAGTDRLVIDTRGLHGLSFDGEHVVAGAGVRLPALIGKCVNAALGGIEGLAGVPASVGGAVVMNAGGRHGEIASVVERVTALTRGGDVVVFGRGELPFAYRSSGLDGLIVTGVELTLERGDAAELKARRDACMAHKMASQPLSASSAGCCFKNPTLVSDVDGVGEAGARVSAGMLIDRAGCKGMSVGGATVSDEHANFIVTEKGSTASDVIALMGDVRDRVGERFGVTIEPEIRIWGADGERGLS